MNKIVVEEIDLDIFQLGHKNIGLNILGWICQMQFQEEINL